MKSEVKRRPTAFWILAIAAARSDTCFTDGQGLDIKGQRCSAVIKKKLAHWIHLKYWRSSIQAAFALILQAAMTSLCPIFCEVVARID